MVDATLTTQPEDDLDPDCIESVLNFAGCRLAVALVTPYGSIRWLTRIPKALNGQLEDFERLLNTPAVDEDGDEVWIVPPEMVPSRVIPETSHTARADLDLAERFRPNLGLIPGKVGRQFSRAEEASS